MDLKLLEIFNFVINLGLFTAVAVLLYLTYKELKFHFNLGNKINFVAVLTSTGLRMALTIYEFATNDYERTAWKLYYKWIGECAFMVFYLHGFFKIIGNRKLSFWVSEKNKATKHLPLKE
jgi:hypothetical protein